MGSKPDYKKEIVKDIQSLSGSKSPYEVFHDWVKCMALAISNSLSLEKNHNDVWKKRESDYLNIVNSYPDKGEKICDMYGKLVMTFEDGEIGDILGEIYMESGSGSKSTGQFFTPFNINQMMGKLVLNDKDMMKPIKLHEPSCGAGGMIIGVAKSMMEKNINYQPLLDVVAQDLDWKAVYMCYVQLSLLGIKAVVVQGDTLAEPYTGKGYPQERVFYTPAKIWRIY